jgi:ankyrin repeat protein
VEWTFGNIHHMAQLLVQRGADVTKEDGEQNTPLHVAAPLGHAECVKVCVENECSLCIDACCKVLVDAKANVDAKDRGGNTPLHLTAMYGCKAGVQVTTLCF